MTILMILDLFALIMINVLIGIGQLDAQDA